MIDYGTYRIVKDGDKFLVMEELGGGREKEFNSIRDLIRYIENDLTSLEEQISKEKTDERE